MISKPSARLEKDGKTKSSTKSPLQTCTNENIKINPHLNDDNDIFRELTMEELNNIEKYVDDHLGGARSKRVKSSRLNAVYDTVIIHHMEIYLPNKQEALNYLDNSGKQPEREALVTLTHYPFNVT